MKKFLLLFVPFILFANIKEIKFQGLIHLSDVSANDISLIKSGDKFDLVKIDNTIKKFYEYGYFEKIEADYTNSILTFKFIEKPIIRKINYKNISDDLVKLLKDRFSLKKGEIYQKKKFEEIKNFIIQYYEAQGTYESSVFIETKRQKAFIDVDILLKKGNELYIKKLNFIGNNSFTNKELESEIENQEKDGLGFLPFLSNGKLNIFKLMQDTNTLRDFYLSKGFLDVKIETPFVISNFDNFSSTVDIKIVEGKRYKINNIEIEVDKENIIDIKTIINELRLTKDRYFNVKLLRKDLEKLKTLVADKGYAFAKVLPDIQKNGALTSIKYKIITGNRVYVSDILIKGNSKTLDRVIRRSIYLTPGALYSYTDKKDSINALNRTGYFDSVNFKEIKVDESHIKVLVTVSEGMTGSLKAGITYSSYEKLGINAAISERNIFGSGQTLSLNLEQTSLSSTYSLSLKNPKIFDSIYSFNTSIYKTTYKSTDYTSDAQGVSFSLGRSIGRNASAGLTYKYEDVTLSNYDANDTTIRPNSIKSAISPYISYNSTDNYFFPTSGMKLSSSFEFAGVGGDEKYLKNVNNAKIFHEIEHNGDLTIVAKYKVKIGAIKDYGYLPINDKFYLGGLGSIRGFKTKSISPKDSDGDLIGGNVMFEHAVELSIPINEKSKLWASAFIDQGGVGNSDIEMIKSSYGVSIDWITPVGPLSFVYAFPLQSDKDDKINRFEFNIGVGF
jgi:outer membrane protein insertion porin family